MADPIIEVNNISKIYKLYDRPSDRLKETFSVTHRNYHKDYYALKNINLTIIPGETIGFVGRNGAGKSTILKILTGVLNPSQGNVKINGKVSALLELGAGFNMDYTGIENIYLNGTIMGIPREQTEKKIPAILEFAEIGDFVYQPVKTYSSGMFVRLAFAVAISVDPDILIVDEALAVGDTRFQLKCMDKFVEFMNAGKTILFVSHDISSIKRFCKRTVWLNRGELIKDGPTDEVTDLYLDFLKSELSVKEFIKQADEIKNAMTVETEGLNIWNIEKNTADIKVTDEEIDQIYIANIVKVQLLNSAFKDVTEIVHGEDVYVKVQYVVRDTSIESPVLGIAIRTIDNVYICGVNTLLDNITIPWRRGVNTCILKYNHLNITGGNYFFDIAIFDKTATVQIDFRAQVKHFFVKMDYIAEGMIVLNHEWEL